MTTATILWFSAEKFSGHNLLIEFAPGRLRQRGHRHQHQHRHGQPAGEKHL
jgi:hypothetical protein